MAAITNTMPKILKYVFMVADMSVTQLRLTYYYTATSARSRAQLFLITLSATMLL